MKNRQLNKNKPQEPQVIKVAPENWQVTGPVNIQICQQPAKIIPWPLLPPLRLPRLDVWQLDEFLSIPKQSNF